MATFRTLTVSNNDEEFKCLLGHPAMLVPAYIPGTHIWETTGKLHCCDCRSDELVKIVRE